MLSVFVDPLPHLRTQGTVLLLFWLQHPELCSGFTALALDIQSLYFTKLMLRGRKRCEYVLVSCFLVFFFCRKTESAGSQILGRGQV